MQSNTYNYIISFQDSETEMLQSTKKIHLVSQEPIHPGQFVYLKKFNEVQPYVILSKNPFIDEDFPTVAFMLDAVTVGIYEKEMLKFKSKKEQVTRPYEGPDYNS